MVIYLAGETYATFALAVALLLIGLLLLKELTGYREGGSWHRLGKALNFAIAPLFVVFLVGVGLRIADALR
jgi:hypothetical protein